MQEIIELSDSINARSMQNKIRVLRVLRYVLLHRRTNNVYLEAFFTGQVESSFCQRGSETHATQFFRDFSMGEL